MNIKKVFCCLPKYLLSFFCFVLFKADHVQCSLPLSFSWWRSGYSDHPDATHCSLDHHHYIAAETGNSDLGTEIIMKMKITYFTPDVHCWIWSCAFNLFALAMSRSECNIKQMINLGWNKFSKTWGFASREKFSVQESSNFLPLCQTRKVLFIFMIAQILFLCWLVLIGSDVVDRRDNDAIIEKPGLKASNVVSE